MAAAGLVAVSTAAEHSGPVASGGNLSGVNCGPSAGTGPGPGPGSWSRSLDRALEEAAITGVLILSGRKLREFPRGAANHDLTDTTRADLSRNRLSEIPIETCHFVSLENLNLYQNCIRYIPEAILNLQALTFLNISRNQLSTLPVHLCNLPLKVLIASNNKLVSLPEEIGHLRHLTELDVSCNEIQTIPSQIGNLEALRDLNLRRNHLVRLPEELAELPLIRLDFSCNKITTIPVCYRNLKHLQMIALDNNPLQSPPAQICIKGKIHIFKYLNIQACKIAPDLPDYDRRPLGFGSCHEELYSGRPYGALDSGFNSVDSGDKRWSGNEPTDEFSDLPLRVAEITKEQRLRRENQYQENRNSVVVANGVEHDLDQIDYIDSCTAEEEEDEVRQPKGLDSDSLSSQFMAYIEQRRISHESSPIKPVPTREFQKTEDIKRYSHQNRGLVPGPLRIPKCASLSLLSISPGSTLGDSTNHGFKMLVEPGHCGSVVERRPMNQEVTSSIPGQDTCLGCRLDPRVPVGPSTSLSPSHNQLSHTDLELPQRREQLVERTRREAQLAALQYEEEKIRTKQIQRDAVLDFVKQKTSHSPQKQQHPLDGEKVYRQVRSYLKLFNLFGRKSLLKINLLALMCPFPSRRSQHTDDSALLVLLSGLKQVGCAGTLPHSSAFTPLKNDDRPNAVSSSPTTETVHHSPAYSFPAATQRNQPQRPESFLFRAGVRAETNKGHGSTLLSSSEPTTDSTDPITRQNTRQREEELESIDQLRKHIEYRLKVSLPCDLGAALTDGVVLCHLANHVWPRSVPSIHVPSPAVPKLSIAKCRRNVENFLEACRKIGVPQSLQFLSSFSPSRRKT
ncbi:DISP complex protein LRCH3 isoform X6 [Myotis daubentonii]|uniref:DISP complex protein LRCH3 isoform X6 n=1 Tax=Myotis daubentonii TaxID=98922 RepID=UPI0028731643|nr:DISP complex protein LRCH3 isoform X6 [Myotis daubentonii]